MSTVASDPKESVRMGLFQRLRFRQGVVCTLGEMKTEGFLGDHNQICDECLKRLMEPKGEAALFMADAGLIAKGDNVVKGPFLDALLAMFTQMMESSMLMKLILMLFGL